MADEKPRKYVVGEKNSAAPVLRIPHRRNVEFKPTIHQTNHSPQKTQDTHISKSDGSLSISHDGGHRLAVRQTSKTPLANNHNGSVHARNFSANMPITPAKQAPGAQRGAANVIRQQISQIPDQNKNLIEREKSFIQQSQQNGGQPVNYSAASFAKNRAESESKKRYHAAWKNYYQTYYERFYAAEMQKQKDEILRNEAKVLLNQKKAAQKANNKPEFSRNYLGAAAGSAMAKMRDRGTIEGEENSRNAEMNQLRYDILSRVKHRAKKARKSRHFWPAIVALAMVVAIGLVQFNGVISAQVANFVSPGSTTGNEIIVGTGSNQPVGPDPQIVIPKINVQAPVQYNVSDLSEAGSQKALENGPIHYPIVGATAFPGQLGNTVILGHSSADWFEPGNYKFIFVQLNRLGAGDLFYLDYQGTRYTYRITKTQIISPDQLGALNLGTDKPYATLITCDPVGTAINRLLVIGEQISPSVSSDEPVQSQTNNTASNITGKPPTLFEKIFGGK